MITTKTIELGTLIHGTLRDEDLLTAFADELVRLGGTVTQDLRDLINACEQDNWELSDDMQEEVSFAINETLINKLNEYAPPHTYFGAHEGDGSDFGFWPELDFDCDY